MGVTLQRRCHGPQCSGPWMLLLLKAACNLTSTTSFTRHAVGSPYQPTFVRRRMTFILAVSFRWRGLRSAWCGVREEKLLRFHVYSKTMTTGHTQRAGDQSATKEDLGGPGTWPYGWSSYKAQEDTNHRTEGGAGEGTQPASNSP